MKKALLLLFILSFFACENMRFTKVSGFVFDDETGEPVAGALVKLYDENDHLNPEKANYYIYNSNCLILNFYYVS